MKAKSKGGNKFKKMKKGFGEILTKLETADKFQNYAQVVSMLGDGRIKIKCLVDNKIVEKLGIIRGSMRKRQWINSGDIVIVCIREFETDKCDVVYVYPKDRRNEIIIKAGLDFGDKKVNDYVDEIEFYNSDDDNNEEALTHFEKEQELSSNHFQFEQKPWFLNDNYESDEDEIQKPKKNKIKFNLEQDSDDKQKIDDAFIDDI
jgi:translation initiation factor 1A